MIKIEINNLVLIYLLVYILIPISIVKDIRVNKGKAILEKSSTNSIKGILVIYIAIHHYVQRIVNPQLLNPLNCIGFLCVSFFFLMSGYGLTLAYNKDNYMKDFLKKRFLRLYFPFVIANLIIGIIYNLILNSQYSLGEILKTSFTMRTIYGGAILWYIYVQILMYIVFYMSFKMFNKREKQIISVIITTLIYIVISKYLGVGVWRYNTVLCFSVGIIIASYQYEIVNLLKKYYYIILVPIIVLFICNWICVYLNIYSYYSTVISSILFSTLITIVTYKLVIVSNIFEFLGDISYEIYIIQLPIINIVFRVMDANIISLLTIIFTTIIVSYVTNKISNFINSILLITLNKNSIIINK